MLLDIREANYLFTVTQLLGESFKIFSHSLAVEDDIGMSHSAASTPASTPEADEEMSDNE